METGCCSAAFCGRCMSRRGFLARSALAGVAAPALGGAAQTRPAALRVQPVFVHQIKTRQEATSWRFSAEIHTEEEAVAERAHIQRDLENMKARAEFPLEILPLATVHDTAEAGRVTAGAHDVLLMYAAGRDRAVMDALALPDKWNLVFVRHRSGRIYYMYIGVHPHFLRKTRDEYGQPGMDVDDVVVDHHADVLWRLRALYGLKNTLGKRIVAVGGPSGWGVGGRKAPERAREVWKLDIQTVSYPDLGERIKRARQNDALVKRCHNEAAKYLKQKNVTLETSKEFVQNAFLLTEIFRDLLDEARTDAITINQCMGTIMPISETCLLYTSDAADE